MSQSHPTPAYTRAQELPATLAKRLVILDGAMGTMIQRFKLGEAQYRGEGYAGADGAGERFKIAQLFHRQGLHQISLSYA